MEREIGSAKLRLGDKAPYFSLPATDGKIYSLSDFAGANALVVIFTSNHCPVAQAYEQRIVELVNRYKSQHVRFVAICANDAVAYPEDNFEHMVEKSKKMNFALPYLQDERQNVALAYDAVCTPEVYLFDKDQKLTYHGGIDDSHKSAEQVKNAYLANALQALLAGGEATPSLTPAIGCTIKWKK